MSGLKSWSWFKFLCLWLVGVNTVSAQPSIEGAQLIAGQRIFRDIKQPALFYYMPFDYRIATDAKGKPELSFIQMRYTGSRATADAGSAKFNNLLQFRVVIDPLQQQKLSEIRTELRKQNLKAELRSLPVRKFSSILVYGGSAAEANFGDSTKMMKTNVEATDETSSVNNSYWTERVISLRLTNEDAQIIEAALRNKSSALAFSYAVYTVFSEKDLRQQVQVMGSATTRKKILDYFNEESAGQADSALHITMVKADAINIEADLELWPTLIQKVDINEKLPAKYPLFDVYCYDFNNEIRDDLTAKKIEIRATGITGASIITSFYFKEIQAEQYSKTIRFPYAIRFDKPFFYRVTEITKDGEIIPSAWKEKTEWSDILDITSSQDKIVRKPKVEDQ